MYWDKLTEKSDELLEHFIENPEGELTDERLQGLAEKLREPGYVGGKLKQQQSFDYRPAFGQVMAIRRRMIVRRALRVAAVIALPLCLGTAAYFMLPEAVPGLVAEGDTAMEVKPGGTKAVLRMADGREVELSGQSREIREVNGAAIRLDSSGLRYEVMPETDGGQEIENCVKTPRGGEFFLTLADGTKVWLNADSELRYPVTFGKTARQVTVVGEAYFEVVRDTLRPFTVRTTAGSVRVLGTKFNVQAYREEKRMVTTLVQGAVACHAADGPEGVVLRSDEQVTIDSKGIGGVRKVRTYLYTGWKEGLFVFEGERLEEILTQLSRWYDVDIFYTDMRLKDLHFSGDLSRFKDISAFLRMFESSADIAFALKGKTLTVGRK